MKHQVIDIKNAKNFVGEGVTVRGWLYNKRESGKIIFLEIRDGSGTIQGIVHQPSVGDELFEKAKILTMESSVIVSGTINKHPKLDDVYELAVSDIEIIQLVTDEYPISKKEHGPEFLLDNRHLWLRSSKQRAIQVVRDSIIHAIYDFFRAEGFTKIDAPILTPNACEGTTDLFEIDYFGKPAYLTQSGQLYLEAAIFSVGKCYCFGPTFRAEKSKTRRHLNEFWMLEAEAAFFTHEDNLDLQEDLIHFVLGRVLERCGYHLLTLEREVESLERAMRPFVRLDYDDASKLLGELGEPLAPGDDLGAPHETALGNHFQVPVFVTHYPKAVKAFYMKQDPARPDRVRCADLLAPEGFGEIIGGSEREENLDKLVQAMLDKGLKPEHYDWYLDLRKYGSVVHS